MGRPANKTVEPADMPAIRPEAANAVVVMQDTVAQQSAQALALATELGYQGALTPGALEDEIRFYQRRSVEALLECGKRLLLLKEVAPHGEFTQRVELLGFHIKSAQRFMTAAAKTAKSDKLSFLATQVKSASAFLELVTHDDDVLDNLKELDDIDRMSASELRAALRQSEQDVKFANEKRTKTQAELDKLEKKLNKGKLQARPLNELVGPFKKEIGERQDLIEKGLAAHLEALSALDAWWTQIASEAPDYDPMTAADMPREVALVAVQLDDSVNHLAQLVGTLQYELQQRFADDLAKARQYLMQEPEAHDA